MINAKNIARKLWSIWQLDGCSISVWWNIFFINLIRKNTRPKVQLQFISTRYCAVTVDKSAQLVLNGPFILGHKQLKNSRLETRLSLGKNAKLVVNDYFTVYYGSDIRIYPNAILSLYGGFCSNGVRIICRNQITIGKDCAIAPEVIIRDSDEHQLLSSEYEISTTSKNNLRSPTIILDKTPRSVKISYFLPLK